MKIKRGLKWVFLEPYFFDLDIIIPMMTRTRTIMATSIAIIANMFADDAESFALPVVV